MTTPLVSRREASPSLRPSYVNDLVDDVTTVRDAHDALVTTVTGLAGPWDVAGAAATAQAAAEAASDHAGAAAAAQAAAIAASDSAGTAASAAAAAQAAAEAASDPAGTATSVVTTAIAALGLGSASTHPASDFDTPAARSAAIAALNLGTASTHPATDFDTPAARAAAISAAITALGLGSASTHAAAEFFMVATDTLASHTPFVLAHRGGSTTHPENTMEAFRAVVAQGGYAIEMDVQTLKDGTLGVMHDSTVDGTTTSSGNITDFTAEGWRALRVKVSTRAPGPVGGVIYQDGVLPVPTFDEVLREFGNKVVIVPEAKSTGVGTGAAMVAMLQKYKIAPSMVLVQSFSLPDLLPAVAAGYPTIYLGDGLDPATVHAAGVNYVGPGMGAVTTANVAAMTAVGIGTVPYTLYRRVDRDALLAKGVAGIFADEPIYLMRSTALMTTDPFSNGTFPPGMNADPVTGDRGTFVGLNGRWGLTGTSAAIYSVTQGWACPVANPNSYTLAFTATFDDPGADSSRWISCHFAEPDDKGYTDQSGTNCQQSGYHFLMRASGTMALYRTDIGVGVTLIATASPAAVTSGQAVPFTIVVTPTTITVTRTDTATAISATDAAYRGGYFALGKNGSTLKASYSGVSIT